MEHVEGGSSKIRVKLDQMTKIQAPLLESDPYQPMESPSFSHYRVGISAFWSIKWEFIHNFGKHGSLENVPAKNRHKEVIPSVQSGVGLLRVFNQLNSLD